MSTALYRRYRPETFEQVVGQEHVTVPLMAALEGDRTNHAYLFSGPRGCGKTTSARILARCLNCAEGPTATPCGECESCRELSRGGTGSLDVVEMDAASHGGVDDARELRERASFAPLRDRYKVFIIDEAHMVSNQGFNALLKLVEEPPPHVKFIFATTEPEKVIGTIRSRTHHYPFRLVPPGILETYLADLARQENVEVGDGVLPLVVRAGTGSVRDSLSVLDQLIGGAAGNTLDYQTAISLLGYTDGALLDSAVDAIANVDGGALFTAVANVVESGHDPRRFVEDLLERLRDLVVLSLAGESAADVLSTIPEDQLARMMDQAERLGASRATTCADLTNRALSDMVGATSPRLQLELLCAKLLLAATSVTPAVQGAGVSLADARAAARSFKKAEAPPAAPAQEAPQAAPPEPREKPAVQAPGRLVPPQEPAPRATVQKEEPARESDEEKLSRIRSMWADITADRRVPRGTNDFIRQHGKVAVVEGVLRFDFPTQELARSFEARAGEIQTVIREKLGEPLVVHFGVTGSPRETADDPEGDSRAPSVAAATERHTVSQGEPPVRRSEETAAPARQGAMSAIARASARSAGSRDSAASPEEPRGASPAALPPLHGGGAGIASSDFPHGEPTPPDDDEYGIIPEQLPPDLPDIVMEDFPKPPPAAMPKFPAPPPREAPSMGGGVPNRTGGVFSRLAESRSVESAPEEEIVDVEHEHELVSHDDPLALEAQGIGLSVVLDVLNATIIEEVEET